MAGKIGMVVSQLRSSMVHGRLDLVVVKRQTLNTGSDYWTVVLEATGQEDHFRATPAA
jgi:hypothetical protein